MDHMTSKSNYGTYEPSATVGGAGNIQQQMLDTLQILTTPQMVVDDPKKLRDQFAMVALIGILVGLPNRKIGPENYAHDAYMFADAMMKEREAK